MTPATHSTWRMPCLLAASSVCGLAAALLGNGLWDAVSWVALGWPVVVVLRHALVRPAPKR